MIAQSRPPTRFNADCVPTPEALVVRFSGRLMLDPRANTNWRACLEASPACNIALDLEQVTDIDATGLGLLAQITEATAARGRRLAIVSANPRIRQLLKVTRHDAAIEGVSARSGCGPRRAA